MNAIRHNRSSVCSVTQAQSEPNEGNPGETHDQVSWASEQLSSCRLEVVTKEEDLAACLLVLFDRA